MKRISAQLAVISLLICLTIEQLNVPLLHRKIEKSIGENTQRHHLLRQITTQKHASIKGSRLSHNVEYIKAHFGKQQQNHEHQTERYHFLNREAQQDHLKLQTFNLKPNIYSFSLPMKIGGYKYQMSIDSGSSDIFIKGQKSQGKPKIRYHCGQTCIDNNSHYQIGYLDGHLKTYETKLEVEIGDHKFNQSILVAYEVQDNFNDSEGLVGLSFPQLASNPNPSFLQTLKNNKIIDAYAFGVNLNFQDQSRSFITFGSYDNKFFEGSLDYFPLTSSTFYYISSKGVSVGNGQILPIKTALFDTGNTCISVPVKYKESILKQFNLGTGETRNQCFFMKQQNAYMFAVLRCRVGNFDTLPTLNIHLGEKKYAIQKQYYIQACDRRPKQSKMSSNKSEGVWYCDTYIETVTGMSQLFLGDGFFNRFYTYFNLQKKQLAIAKNKQSITIDKLIKNKLQADEQDWQIILTNTDPSQSKDQINAQLENLDEKTDKQENSQ